MDGQLTHMNKRPFLSGMTTIVTDDWQLAYSLYWRYGSVLGKNSLRIHAA